MTALVFSRKVFLVLSLLFGLYAVRSVLPFTIALLGYETYYTTYQVTTYASSAVMALILGLNDRMSVFKILLLILLAFFSPVEAAILYLILTFSKSADEH